MNELRKLKAQQRVQNRFSACKGLDIIKILPLALNLGSKIRIYQEKKEWTGTFKVLAITDINITVDIGNSQVTFQNMYVKLYNRHLEETDISNLERANDLTEKPADKEIIEELANKETPMHFEYPEPQKPY